MPNLFQLFNLVVFYKQRCCHEEISEKTTITGSDDSENSSYSRNATQDNGNINNFWKGRRWFCLQCLRTICYFLRQNHENGCLENYIGVRALKHRPVPNDQLFYTRCMLCLLQSTVPANSAPLGANHTKSRKHIVDFHVFFQIRTRLH